MKSEYKPPKSKKVEAILQAARDLFSVKGFESTPVAEVARRANVADGTVIYYFKTKENLLFILTRQIFYELYKSAREAAVKEGQTAMQALESFVDAHARFVIDKRSDYMVLLKADPFRILSKETTDYQDAHLYASLQVELISEILKRGVAAQEFAEIDFKNVSYTIYSMLLCAGRFMSTVEGVGLPLYEEIKTFIRMRLHPGNAS